MNKKTQLKNIFIKIYLKIYLGKKQSNDNFFFLDLVREEIKIIILATVTKECEQLLNFLLSKGKHNIKIEEALDLFFRLILISAKNKILTKLKLDPPKYIQSIKLKKNWLLSLLEFENYGSFVYIINNIFYEKFKTRNSELVTIKLVLEHLILKISDLIIYDIFLTKKFPTKLLIAYTIDEVLFRSYMTKIPMYLIWKLNVNTIIVQNKQSDIFRTVMTFTKTGLIARTLIIENSYSILNVNKFIINRPLKVLENILFAILQVLAKN